MRTNLKRLICGVSVCALVISCVPMTGCAERIAAKWRDGKIKEGDVTETAENARAYYGYEDDVDSWRDFIETREYDESEDGDETVYYSYSKDDDEYTPIHGHDVDTDDEDADPVYRLTDDGEYKRVKNYEAPSDAEIAAQDDDVYYLKIDADGDDELENFTVVHGYNLEEGDEVYDLVDGEFVAMDYVTPEPEEEEEEEEEDADSVEEDAYEEDDGETSDADEEDGSETSGYYTEEDGSYEAVATEDLVDGETYYQMSEDGDGVFEEVTYEAEEDRSGTAEDYREFIIKEKILGDFVDDEVERRDLSVSQKKVDKEVEEAREETEAQYMEGVFESVLQSYGYADLEAYEETVEEDLLEDKLMLAVTGMDDDDEGYDESEAEELYDDWLDDLYDNLLEVDVKDPPSELTYDPDFMEEDIQTRQYYSYDEDKGTYSEIEDITTIADGDTVYYEDDGVYEEYEWVKTYYSYDEDADEYTEIEDTSTLADGDTVYLKNSEGEYVEETWELDDEDDEATDEETTEEATEATDEETTEEATEVTDEATTEEATDEE